jgi:hypothetical protein
LVYPKTHWEARVEHVLKDHPRRLALFRYDPPPKNPFQIAVRMPLAENPLKYRLHRRIVALEKVIRETH